MRIYEYGKENPESILLIHPSLVTWDYFENVVPLLERHYLVGSEVAGKPSRKDDRAVAIHAQRGCRELGIRKDRRTAAGTVVQFVVVTEGYALLIGAVLFVKLTFCFGDFL